MHGYGPVHIISQRYFFNYLFYSVNESTINVKCVLKTSALSHFVSFLHLRTTTHHPLTSKHI